MKVKTVYVVKIGYIKIFDVILEYTRISFFGTQFLNGF